MVVDENAKSSGKGNSASKFLVDGVAAAILTLGAAQAFATDWDITGPTTTPLTLNDGDSVAIQIGGSINTGALLNTPAISNTIGATIGYINNMGTVSSVGSSNSANAIDLIGGTISGGISNAGSIFGGFNGISVSNNARVIGPIINSGTITGTGVRANGVGFYGNYPDAIGAYATVAGSIVNTGLIQAISSESLAAGLYFEANGTTSIGNAQFGNISNEGLIDGRGASLAGAGSFAGDGFGIEIRSVNLVNMEGSHQSLQNSGTLSGIGGSVEGLNSSGGNGYGFDIHSGSLSNWFIPGSSIQNNGLILGLGGSALNDSSIAGSGFGVNVSTGSIGINHPTSSGAISNNNLIEGVGGDATGVSAIAGAGYGMNLSTASIGAWSGPSIANPTVAGGIVNSGTILGRGGVASGSMGTSGIGVGIALSNSTTNNGLINSGLIQGIGGSALSFAGAGIGIQASESFLVGGIENRGTIQGLGGSSSGISSAAAGDGQGLVIGANSLLYGLSNSGLIQGVGGISLGSSVSAGLGHGIALSSSIIVGDVSNSGTIQGMGGNTSGTSASSGAGKGLLVTNGSQATSFINSGLIIGSGGNSSISTLNTGVGYGFEISNSSITGGINNSGTIQGIGGNYASLRTARGYGIFIGADANIAGGITNSGLISGNTNAIYVDSTATVSRINVSGNNSARFDGSIYAPNTGLYVTSGSTFTLSSSSPYIVREFYNEGTIVLNPGSPSTIAGLTSNGLFTQAIDGSMEVVVRGTQSGAYGSLYIDGSASVAGSINLNFLSSSYGISSGSTIAGVLIDTAGITSSGLNVTSNSVLLTFSGQIIGNQLDIVALGTNAGVCAGTVAVNSTGPCLVGFDSPSLVVNSGVTISGGNAGIRVLTGFSDGANASGFGINNQGHVQGYPFGIELQSGATLSGGITNAGVIGGGTDGVYLRNAKLVGPFQNSGVINPIYQGIILENSSIVGGLNNSGLITGINAAVNLSGSYVEDITNTGTISSSGNAFYLVNGSTVNGQFLNSGSIQGDPVGYGGGRGLLLSQSALNGDFINAGKISGNTAVELYQSNLIGTVANSGTLSGVSNGLYINGSSIAGSLINTGSVAGYDYAVYLASSTLGGGITNNGTLSGVSNGIYIDGSSIAGSLINTGSVAGASAIVIASSSLGAVNNSGTLSGAGYGLYIAGSSVAGSLINAGSVASNETAVYLVSSTLGGGIANSGTLSGVSNGLYISGSSIAGSLINTGSVAGGAFLIASSVEAVNNSGTLSGAAYGLVIADSSLNGSLINAGSVASNETAVYLVSSTLGGGIANSGTLSGTDYGLYINGSSIAGSLINAGSVAGNDYAVYLVSSTLDEGIANSGTLSGAGYGLYIAGSSVAGSLINAGSVAGALAIVIASSSLGAVNNSGTLSGTDYGLYIVGSSIAGFINSGLIIGVNNNSYSYSSDEQVYVGGDSGYGLFAVNNIILGSYSNSGLIQGFGRAENIEATVNGSSVTGRASLEVYSGSGIGAMFYDGFSEGGLINTGSVIGVAGNNNIQGVLAQPIDPSLLDGGLDVFATGGIGLGIGVQGSTSAGSINNQGLIEGVGGNVSTNVTYINSSLSTSLSHLADGGGGTGVRFIYSDLSEVVNSGIIRGVGGSSQAMITESASYASTNLRVQGGDGVGLDITDSLINRNFENSGLIEGWGGSAAASNTSTTVQGGIGAGVRLNSLNYTDSPVFVDTTIVGSIINSGTIQGFGGSVSGGALANGGDGFGMLLGGFDTTTSLTGGVIVSQGITNSGLLQGNSGLAAGADAISGNGYGVFITSNSVVERGIRNSGTITGNSAAGLYLSNATINGGINNIGLIGGGNQGIAINESSLVTGGINNSGTISGRLHSIYLDNSSILSGGINIAGTSAALIGDLSASTSTLNIQSGAIFGNTNSINVGSLNIESGAIFNLSQGSSTTYGSAIAGALSIASGVQVTDSVRNAGTLAVIAGQSPTITGDYQQETRGIYQTQLVSANNYGKFNVTGTATLNTGSVINVNVVNTPYIANQTTLSGILNAGSLTAGSVSNVTVTDDSNWLEFAASSASNPNSLDLIVTQSLNMVTAVEQNNNPSAIGSATVLQGFAVNPSATMQGVVTRLYEQPTTLAVSNAISQTVPVLVGAGSLIAAQTQQNLNQIMQGRQNQLRGLSSGEEFIGNRHAWMRGFGSWASQGDVNNVSGYKVNTGGLAIGIDHELSPKANIGAVFAFANSSVNSNSSAAPSSMTINSYQLGAYGDYSLRQNLQINYQLDFGLNNNKESRNLSAFNGVPGVSSSSGSVNANGNYNSYVGHLGVGLRQFYPMAHKTTTLIPSVRADYTTVQSSSYTETGAGSLNLSANSQTYNMMVLAADMRVDHMLSDKLKLSANLGGGYNTLNNQVQMVTAFQGGGPAFTTNGLQTSPWLYGAGLGLSGRVSKEIELNVRYDTQFSSSSYNNQMVSAKLKFFY